MRKRVAVLVSALGVSTSVVARAADPPHQHAGFQLAWRSGYSQPVGKAWQGHSMSDVASGQVPILLDIGGKPIPSLFLGLSGGFAFGGSHGFTKAACRVGGGGCSTESFHLGIAGHWHFLPGGWLDPWVGLGIGLESLTVAESKDGSLKSTSLSGVEFGHLLGGADWRPTRHFGVGPFLDVSLGRYASVKTGSATKDISDKALHSWVTLGVRFVLLP
jgi:hypothetical protein